jgi:hypothetical protein
MIQIQFFSRDKKPTTPKRVPMRRVRHSH